MLTVKTMMTRTLVSVTMDATLEEIQKTFEVHGFHHLVVLEKNKPVGIISDRDILRELSPFIGKMAERTSDTATLNRKAHQIMSRKIHTASEDTNVGGIIRSMLEHKIGCLTIVDDKGNCVGIITMRDILRWCADQIFCVDEYCQVDEPEESEDAEEPEETCEQDEAQAA